MLLLHDPPAAAIQPEATSSMSERNDKEGIVIDVTPEPEVRDIPTDEAPAQSNTSPAPTRFGLGGLLLAVVALLAVVGLAVAAVQMWRQSSAELARIDARIAEAVQAQGQLQAELDDTNAALASQQAALSSQNGQTEQQRALLDQTRQALLTQEQRLADERLRMQERENELRAAVADVHRRVGRSGTQWMVAEAEYLIRIANHRLTLARDVDTARAALGLADARLYETGDPGWGEVRVQLARDLTKLAGLALPDFEGLSARLDALIEQSATLKLSGSTAGVQPGHSAQTADTAPERSLSTLLGDLWQGLKSAVRIRRHDQPVQAMLPPEQQFFLYANLRLQLQAARLALSSERQALFVASLDHAIATLQSYFDTEAATTRSTVAALQDLRQRDIRPTLPDISRTLEMLKLRAQLLVEIAPGAAASQDDAR